MVDAVNKQPVIKILILKLLKNEPVEVPKDDNDGKTISSNLTLPSFKRYLLTKYALFCNCP